MPSVQPNVRNIISNLSRDVPNLDDEDIECHRSPDSPINAALFWPLSFARKLRSEIAVRQKCIYHDIDRDK
jgi:hypothetical protein